MKRGVDRSRVQQAMAKLATEQRERQEAARAREKELAAVKVRGGLALGGGHVLGGLPPRALCWWMQLWVAADAACFACYP